ncbi:MAG: XdhC family protein [Kiloniellales bacterium]
MKRATLDAILAARDAKRPAALVTDLKSGLQSIVYPNEITGELGLNEDAVAAARGALGDDRSGRIEDAGAGLFVQVFNPPARLILVGAVHIAQPLAPMAALAGYAVAVVDPRGAFATDRRFPGVRLIDEWPDQALAALAPDRRTAVVTLTHDPKLDDPALEAALRSEAFYIGALGSRRTHAARLERLRAAGFDDADLRRIHGPVGLSIGATSPAEIALSILAQITQVAHQREAA